MKTRICASCEKPYQRKQMRANSKYCSMACLWAANVPRIPDGQPMSERTQARRKSEAGLTKPRPRRQMNEDFFFSWSDELAWLLGLIWSDGCLTGPTGNVIAISSKDRDLMETFARLVGLENGIYLKNGGRAYEVRFSSTRVTQYLRGLGLTERKSLTANWPALPEEYRYAFVRGLLDGDGTASLSQKRKAQQAPDLRVAFCGAAPDIRGGLQAWLTEHRIRYYSNVPHYPVWNIAITEIASLRTLYHLLYPNDQVCALGRKKANYDTWMVTPRPSRSAAVKAAWVTRRAGIDGKEL